MRSCSEHCASHARGQYTQTEHLRKSSVEELEAHQLGVSDHVSCAKVLVPPLAVPCLPPVGLTKLNWKQAHSSLSKPPHLGVQSPVGVC